MNKIVLIAYHAETDNEVSAILSARSALFHMPSDNILKRFEVFDVVDSEVNS